MAKLNKGILGPIIGKLGPVVGSSWKGIPYIKIINRDPANRKRSPAQLAHHQKFSFITKWLQPLHPFVLVGFQNLADQTTEINAAFSYNFKEALKGNGATLSIEWEKARVSMGRLMGLHEPAVHLEDKTTLRLRWNNIQHPLSVYNDQLMLVLYNDELGCTDGFVGGIKRSAKTCAFTLDNELVGKYFHVFVGLTSLDGKEVSESQYLGKIEPL